MYPVSDLFKSCVSQANREFEIKAEIDSITYLNTEVVEFEIEDSLMGSEELTLGTVVSSKLTISIRTANIIPSNAKVAPYVRLKAGEGYTEWLPLGEYYIDSRSVNNNVWKFTCYDKLIITQQPFVSTLVYPAVMNDVMDEICAQLGVVRDTTVAIDAAYEIPYATAEFSIRDVLSYIASSNGASVRMTKDGKIAFVKFSASATKTSLNPSAYSRVLQTNPLKTITRIVVTYNTDNEFLEIGSGDEAHTMNFYNPYITEESLTAIYSAINGLSYMPFTMDWKCFPYLEVGDALEITQIEGIRWNEANIPWEEADIPWDNTITFSTIMMTSKMSFKGGLYGTITAPSKSAQKSEFNFKGSLTQQVQTLNKTAIKEDKPYYGVTIGRAKGVNIKRSDNKSEVTLNSDVMDWKVGGQSTLYYDVLDNKLKYTGDIIMLGGSISWENVNRPSAVQVGAKPYDWLPSYSEVTGSKPPTNADNTTGVIGVNRLTYIDQNGAYFGILTANQINAISGITLGANASIDWSVMNKPSATQVGARPNTWTPSAYEVGALPSNTYIPTVPSYIKSTYIDSTSIQSPNISGGTITGVMFQTATSGKRIEITTNGMLTAYDSSGIRIGSLEDYALKSFVGNNYATIASVNGVGWGLSYNSSLTQINLLDIYNTPRATITLNNVLKQNGTNGTFTSANGKTVTVYNGQITNIA